MLSKYPCALFRPKVFVGYFGSEKHHTHQKSFFDSLLKIGFRRTFWQLVFTEQTAGLIKRIPLDETGVNEYHIRFYKDGIIECELEMDRWSSKHWTGPRIHKEEGKKLLIQILEELKDTSNNEKEELLKLFGTKSYTLECVRPCRSLIRD